MSPRHRPLSDQWNDFLGTLAGKTVALDFTSGDELVRALADALADPEVDQPVRSLAAVSLAYVGFAQREENPCERIDAMYSLCGIGSPLAEEFLRAVWNLLALRESGALAQLRTPRSAEALRIGSLEPDPQVRLPSTVGLAQLGEREAITVLHGLLQGQDRDLRLWAIWWLGLAGDISAVPLLADLLQDADIRQDPERPVYRRQLASRAATALGYIASPDAVAALCDALTESDAVVRGCVAHALGKVGDRNVLPALRGRLRPFNGEWNRDIRWSIRASIKQIEAVTKESAVLPIPTHLPLSSGLDFPLPGRNEAGAGGETPS
jgi:HEAT repeat protein